MSPLDFIGAHVAVAGGYDAGETITLKVRSQEHGWAMRIDVVAHVHELGGIVRSGELLSIRLRLEDGADGYSAMAFALAEVLALGVATEAGRKGGHSLLWALSRSSPRVRGWLAAEAPKWWACVRDTAEAKP